MKATTPIVKSWLFIALLFAIFTTASCKKSSKDENLPEYGCESKTNLETLNNTPGLLVYNPTQAEWQVSIDLGSNRKFSCIFCNKSAYASKIAGQSTSSVIPVTVSGSVKRRVVNQIPITPTTGYVEVYVLTTTSVN